VTESKLPACTGPIGVADRGAVQLDIAKLKAAVRNRSVGGCPATAASPGVIALFLANEYYPSREAYLAAIARAMKEAYSAIAGAGLVLQLDCPDLAMGRHIQFGQASLEEFRRQAALNVEALNEAVSDIPPEQLRQCLLCRFGRAGLVLDRHDCPGRRDDRGWTYPMRLPNDHRGEHQLDQQQNEYHPLQGSTALRLK
jgi:hypothetical protein